MSKDGGIWGVSVRRVFEQESGASRECVSDYRTVLGRGRAGGEVLGRNREAGAEEHISGNLRLFLPIDKHWKCNHFGRHPCRRGGVRKSNNGNGNREVFRPYRCIIAVWGLVNQRYRRATRAVALWYFRRRRQRGRRAGIQ